MSKIENAKQILELYKKNGFKYNTNLMQSDYKEINKTETFLKFFKYTKTDVQITEELADQVVNHYHLGKTLSRLEYFRDDKLRTKKGFFILEYDVKPNKELAEVAHRLHSTTKDILLVYKNQKDTPEFDKVSYEFANTLKNVVTLEAQGDYGVIFNYTIRKLDLTKEEELKKLSEIDAYVKNYKNSFFEKDNNQEKAR